MPTHNMSDTYYSYNRKYVIVITKSYYLWLLMILNTHITIISIIITTTPYPVQYNSPVTSLYKLLLITWYWYICIRSLIPFHHKSYAMGKLVCELYLKHAPRYHTLIHPTCPHHHTYWPIYRMGTVVCELYLKYAPRYHTLIHPSCPLQNGYGGLRTLLETRSKHLP